MNALTKNGVGAGSGPDDNATQAGHLIAHALTSEGHDASEDGTGRGTPLVPVAFTSRGREHGAQAEYQTDGIHPALRAGRGGGRRDSGIASPSHGVRRLTPRECERLQGFPDDWTLIRWRGKPASDSRRYAALGDAVTVPVAEWIGRRLAVATASQDRAA